MASVFWWREIDRDREIRTLRLGRGERGNNSNWWRRGKHRRENWETRDENERVLLFPIDSLHPNNYRNENMLFFLPPLFFPDLENIVMIGSHNIKWQWKRATSYDCIVIQPSDWSDQKINDQLPKPFYPFLLFFSFSRQIFFLKVGRIPFFFFHFISCKLLSCDCSKFLLVSSMTFHFFIFSFSLWIWTTWNLPPNIVVFFPKKISFFSSNLFFFFFFLT